VRVLGHEEALQGQLLGVDAREELLDLIVHAELTRGGGVLLERDEPTISIDERPEPRVFHRQITELTLAPIDGGIGEQAPDLLMPLVELLELAPDGVFHNREL
jgi:hypothetical protein